MTEIAAYTIPMQARGGDRLGVHASTDAPTWTARLVRLYNGDVNPDGPGPRRVHVPSALDGRELPGARKAVQQGSYGVVEGGPRMGARGVTLDLWLWPSRPATGAGQTAFAFGDEHGSLTVGTDADGRLSAVWSTATAKAVVTTQERQHPRRWIHVVVAISPGDGTLRLSWDVATWPRDHGHLEVDADLGGWAEGPRWISFGATAVPGAPASSHFDGKVGAPVLLDGAVDGEALLTGASHPGTTLAAWAFADGPATDRVPDPVGGHDARLVNLPTRAVTGPRWRGRTDVVEAPQDYDAIHFHIDDLDDAGWSEDIAFSLPDDLDSGVYAVELTDADGAQDTVPVFVLPPAGRATSDVALLMPTMSYLAYANERMQEHPKLQSPGWLSRPIIPDEGDLHLQRHPEYGSSIYDTHLDGSGVCLSSARRPVMNLRPGHRNWQTHAPRALAADLLTVEFLDQEGIAVDIITDHEVHEHGTDLLKRYRVVLTGSHPEYVSDELLDALEAWLDAGGRLVYLGGNGWYWVTSIHPEHPWVVEVRRGIGGIRTWESAPGELRHQSTLEPGGLWRYRGRDPNRLVGSGFSGQGFDPVAPGYALREEASDPRAAWIFEGIDDDVVGDSGLILGGAAGDEIDRYDKRWGTPPHALRIATSQGLHTEFVLLVSEDLPVTHPNVGADVHPAVRADLVFFETHGGGAVFSVGSMAFPGALVADEGRTSAAQMLRNVLARFRDPALFPAPPAAEPLPYISQASAVGPIPGEEEPRPAEPEAARTMA